MTKNQIAKSGFFKLFIASYIEQENYLLTDRLRLLYILADNDEQKQKLTLIEIEKLKDKIKSFNKNECELLSYSYIASTKPNHPEFIKVENRFNFWVEKFTENYIDNIIEFNIVTRYYKKMKKYNNDGDFEDKFWNLLKYYKPEKTDINLIMSNETKLIELIKETIKWNRGFSDSWEIDFDDFKYFTNTNIPILLLFEHCELLFALETLAMFKSFINKPYEEIEEKLSFMNTLWFKVGISLANGEIDRLILSNGNNYTRIAQILGNRNYRPYISESLGGASKSDKNIFKNQSKLLKIYQYCIEKKIEMTDNFKKKIDTINKKS